MASGDENANSHSAAQSAIGPLRRSGRRRQAPKQFVPEEINSGWESDEKKRLLEALTRDNGKYDWEAMASYVQTKSVVQVRTYVTRIRARARRGASAQRQDKPPIDEWISLSDKLSKDSPSVRQCLSKIMHLASVEPLPTTDCPTPNYSLIYKYLACLIDGQTVPDLPPTESVVVLDLVRDLMQHLSGCNIRPQRVHMRRIYPELLKKATSQPAETEAASSTSQESAEMTATSTSDSQSPLQPSVVAAVQSFNPFDIPVTLLNPAVKVLTDDIAASDVNKL